MPKPCPAALAAFGVPAKRWETRTDLLSMLERAKAFLDTAPNGTSISDAAGIANLSPYHFAHRFRETYGVSPATYHRGAVLARARLLLTDSSVSEVADTLGYLSVSAFVRAFRRAYKVTPGSLSKPRDPQLR